MKPGHPSFAGGAVTAGMPAGDKGDAPADAGEERA
jgi:hypothetical protein